MIERLQLINESKYECKGDYVPKGLALTFVYDLSYTEENSGKNSAN